MRATWLLALSLLLAGCSGKPASPAASSDPDEGALCKPTHPPANAYLYGIVADTRKVPLAGALVAAKHLSFNHWINATTGADGCYVVDLGVSEPHDVTASKLGYAAQTAKGVVLNVNEQRRINFHLPVA